MVVYGFRSTKLDSVRFPVECASCRAQSHFIHVYQGYFHIFWIPVFPTAKKAFLECESCKLTTEQKALTGSAAEFAQKAKAARRFPVWMLSGSVLIALIFAGAYFEEQKAKENTAIYRAAPAVGDLAVIASDTQFGVIKLTKVFPEGVEALHSKYVYKTASAAERALKKETGKDEYFYPEMLELTRAEFEASPFIKRPTN